MKADAIVVAYHSSEVIRQCVTSLQSDPSIERILVVNNSAGDETSAALQSLERVIYVDAPSNLGFGSAINLVRTDITAPYVVLANPDTESSPETTSELLRFIVNRPTCALVGPRLVTPTGDPERNSQHDLSLVRMVFEALGWPDKLRLVRPLADHLIPHPTDCVIGAFVLCRVAALNDVGWFDESIFLFGEDQDICRRLRAVGWEIWYAPAGHVRHLDGHSWRQLSDQGTELFRQARYRELRKAAGTSHAEAYRWLARARAVLRRPG